MNNLIIGTVIGESNNGWSRITAGTPSFSKMIGNLSQGITPMPFTEMVSKETGEKARVYQFDNATLYSVFSNGKSFMYIKTDELQAILADMPALPFNLAEMDRSVLPTKVQAVPVA